MIDRIKADATALALAEAGDWEACATRLNAIAQPTRKPIEQSRYTWVGLQKALGDTQYLTLRTKLSVAIRQAEQAVAAASAENLVAAVAVAERLKSFFDVLGTSPGPAFADPQTQANIATLSAILTEPEVAALEALGFVPATVVSADNCKHAWASENQASFDSWFNQFVSASLHDKTSAKAAIIANLEEW